MEIGIVGLGRMGAGMAPAPRGGGAHVVCHDKSESAQAAIAGDPNVELRGEPSPRCAAASAASASSC